MFTVNVERRNVFVFLVAVYYYGLEYFFAIIVCENSVMTAEGSETQPHLPVKKEDRTVNVSSSGRSGGWYGGNVDMERDLRLCSWEHDCKTEFAPAAVLIPHHETSLVCSRFRVVMGGAHFARGTTVTEFPEKTDNRTVCIV